MHIGNGVSASMQGQYADYGKDSYLSLNELGHRYLAEGETEKAKECFRSSLDVKENIEALRALSSLDESATEIYLNRCCVIEPSKENFIALLEYLIGHNEYSYAKLVYESLDSKFKDDSDIRVLFTHSAQ